MSLSQPGIFNALDYGLSATNSPSDNQGYLQDAIWDCQAAGGGTVLIPSEDLNGNTVYPIVGPIDVGDSVSGSAEAVIIAGTGSGQEKAGANGPTLLVEGDGTLFSVSTTKGHIGGVTFKDIGIQFDQNPDTDEPYSGTAIEVPDGENVRILRVWFYDCVTAVNFASTLQCSIFQCTVLNENITPNPAIQLGSDMSGTFAKETYIAACTVLAFKLSNGGTGLGIQGSEHTRVANVRLEGHSTSILIQPSAGKNATKLFFGNVSAYPSNADVNPPVAALWIQPMGYDRGVSEAVFVDCAFEPAENAQPSLGPGIYIANSPLGDPAEGDGIVDNVRFVSCKSTRWSGPGLEIAGGSDIEVVGGLYSGNASDSSPSGGSGGISITGAASGVRILGAACVGTYWYFTNDSQTASAQQDVGIYIAGSEISNVIIDHCDLTGNADSGVLIAEGTSDVSDIFIRHCNVSGYGSSPGDAIDVAGSVSNLQVTDCAGYNDLAAAVRTTAPSSSPFSATTYGYYGPATVYGAGSSNLSVTLAGSATTLGNGSFVLGPGQSLTFAIGIGGHTWTTFLMVGQ